MTTTIKKSKTKLLKHDTSRTLGNVDLVFRTFTESLKAGDAETALEVLAARLRLLNKSKLATKYHIPRRTTYNLLDKGSNPSLELIARVCLAIEKEATAR